MSPKQIRNIARNTIENVRGHFGPRVWDYVNIETRKGWVARRVVVEFAMARPEAPASDVARVMAATDAIIDEEDGE